jgi:hypothetical protein
VQVFKVVGKQKIVLWSAVGLLLLQISGCNKTTTDPEPLVVVQPPPVVVAPSCTDSIKNQDEVEIDCGGSSCMPCKIKYPSPGLNGANVLSAMDTIILTGSNYQLHTFKATVPVGSSLKIVAKKVSGSQYGTSNNSGWNISSYSTSTGIQTFEILNPGTAELAFTAFPANVTNPDPATHYWSGKTLLSFYENSTTVTRTLLIIWN